MSSDSGAQGPPRKKRAYGVACTSCREKKISCDGVRPLCGGCKETGEDCRPPVSARPLRRLRSPSSTLPPGPDPAIAQLEARMRWMERRVKQLEDMMDVPPGWTNPPSPSGETAALDHRPFAATSDSNAPLAGPSRDAKYRLTYDESGNVVYHGMTGWSHGPEAVVETRLPSPEDPIGMTNSSLAPIFQGLAISKHIFVAPELGDALLNAYFCYQVFNIIQRSTFLRDMALGGPPFSKFLLMAMYASATRMIDGMDDEQRRTQGELFIRLAKQYLAEEMEGPAKLTTIQGLLLLSGRECAMGNVGQGWNHAGLAFRMAQDLGIHLAPETLSGLSKLSAQELASRDRLFWSCFIWDKAMAFALGREPTFPPRLGRDPSTMLDFDDDEEAWFPFHVNPLNCPPALIGYVYQPKRRVAAFRYIARVCLILHDIIMDLYSSESRLNSRQRAKFVPRTSQRLDELFSSVPEAMKFNSSLPSPPPWVFMFQMLYHASYILLHRPVLEPASIASATGHVAACLEHSVAVNDMTVSFTQTFGERLTYVSMYSSFVASSFDIVLIDSDRLDIQMEALMRLRTWLGIMEGSVLRVPSIKQPVQNLLASTCAAVSRYPVLAVSDAGSWILSHSLRTTGTTPVNSSGTNDGTGAFDFFDLLGSS